MRQIAALAIALACVAGGCSDTSDSTDSSVPTSDGAAITTTTGDPSPDSDLAGLAITFDGVACAFSGQAVAAEGSVDLRFNNTSDEPFAVAVNQVERYGISSFLRDAEIGTDWDIPTARRTDGAFGSYHRWPVLEPGESQEYSWVFTSGTYIFDCVFELEHVWRAGRLDVGDENGVLEAPPDHPVGGDLLLEMAPGSGPGEEADQFLNVFGNLVEPFGVEQGSADHVAKGAGEQGPVHIITFVAARENPRGGEAEFCVMVLPGGGGCGQEPEELTYYGWAAGSVEAFVGRDAVEAVFATESGMTVSLLVEGGWAYAEWPPDWGSPTSCDVYDGQGALIDSLAVSDAWGQEPPETDLIGIFGPVGDKTGVAGDDPEDLLGEIEALRASAAPGRLVAFVHLGEPARSSQRPSQPFCVGVGSYAGLAPGAEVWVSALGEEQPPAMAILRGSAIDAAIGCGMWFGIDVAPGDPYLITIGGFRAVVDAADLDASGWVVELWSDAGSLEAHCEELAAAGQACPLAVVLDKIG